MQYKKIKNCRICKSSDLTITLQLGDQYLTGVFPKTKNSSITKGPLDLCLCQNCGLLQLMHSYNLNELYGDNYGYRSGLNLSKKHSFEKKSGIRNISSS